MQRATSSLTHTPRTPLVQRVCVHLIIRTAAWGFLPGATHMHMFPFPQVSIRLASGVYWVDEEEEEEECGDEDVGSSSCVISRLGLQVAALTNNTWSSLPCIVILHKHINEMGSTYQSVLLKTVPYKMLNIKSSALKKLSGLDMMSVS